MSDRLPEPLVEVVQPMAAERASATPLGVLIARERMPVLHARSDNPRGLRELQAFLVDAISERDECSIVGVVREGPRLPARERLGIYRYAYRARLTECLRDDYPALAATLGETKFDALCDAYIEQHPSTSPSLNAFGQHMPSVCASVLQESQASAAFCAELAALEWALVEMVHAQAPVPFDLAALQQIPADAWGSARFIASDTVRLLELAYPVNAYYQAYRTDGECPPLPAAKASATAVYRIDQTLWRMDLTPAMTRVLRALLARKEFAEALGQLGVDEQNPAALAEAERSVMIWFKAWVRAGFFARIETRDSQ